MNATEAATKITELVAQMSAMQVQFDSKLEDYKAEANEAMDHIYMLLSGILVWIMSAGFCFLEMGSVRYKNTQNVLAKNIVAPVLAFLCWYVTGYGLAFGTSKVGGRFAGSTLFVMDGFWDDKKHLRKWFFQGCFCDTSASIVSGGVAERMTLIGFAIHTIFMTGLIYPICVYWAWSGSGWLNYVGEDGVARSVVGPAYQDWAGSGVIHMVGGTAALVGAVVVGPRKGRFDPAVDPEEFAPHSIPFTVLGTFILWFGWYGFNPGCTPSMHSAESAYASALAAVNTTLAPCTAGVVAFILRATVAGQRRLDVGALCNGVLAGCVAITGSCAYVKPWEGVIIGAISGLLYVGSAEVIPRLKIDDPIDALSVHFVNGVWGALALGFFGDPKEGIGGNGVLYGGDQLGVQVVGVIVMAIWSGATSFAVFVPLRLSGLLRWTDEFQDLGADEMQHTPRKSFSAPSLASGPGNSPMKGGMPLPLHSPMKLHLPMDLGLSPRSPMQITVVAPAPTLDSRNGAAADDEDTLPWPARELSAPPQEPPPQPPSEADSLAGGHNEDSLQLFFPPVSPTAKRT